MIQRFLELVCFFMSVCSLIRLCLKGVLTSFGDLLAVLEVVEQLHLENRRERERLVGLDLEAHHGRERLPVPVAHALVAQRRNERHVGREGVHLDLDLLGHLELRRELVLVPLEELGRLGDGKTVRVDLLLDLLRVEVEKRAVQPLPVRGEPVVRGLPQVVVRLERLLDLAQLLVLGDLEVEQALARVEQVRLLLRVAHLLGRLGAAVGRLLDVLDVRVPLEVVHLLLEEKIKPLLWPSLGAIKNNQTGIKINKPI